MTVRYGVWNVTPDDDDDVDDERSIMILLIIIRYRLNVIDQLP